ncbi:16S rRNA processing protein RimM [Bacilli bacterium PM5-3]|nr:16S rRNA processing protein RimM [Bacilli bacterium PM5-3]MDH6604047.1 16S rRNA processing protein RimM [Bacilli bacterium PM5-9]
MEMINVGYIAGFHGLKGEMKIKTTTDFIKERFAKGSELFLIYNNDEILVKIKSYREHKGMPLISFEGYNSLNDVEKYKGSALKVTSDMLYDLDEEEYYHFDLIGLDVETFNGEVLGKVKSVMETGANDVIVLEKDGKDILVPFIKTIVDVIDIENKKIVLFEVEGLW